MTKTRAHRTGRVPSGDVELFYRRFGVPGGAPLLLLHGANYYDSADWIDVAGALAVDREVVAFDARGYGQSRWSPSRDYSLSAQLADIEQLLEHLGWSQAALVGHSRGGAFALRFAAQHPERVAGLVLVDFSPGHVPSAPGPTPLGSGGSGAIHETLAAALASTSRDQAALEDADKRERLEEIFAQRDGGWVNVRRDPAVTDSRGNAGRGSAATRSPQNLWEALGSLSMPVLVVRGRRSPVYDDHAVARVREVASDARIVEVDSQHDVPGEAPVELTGAIRSFLADQPPMG